MKVRFHSKLGELHSWSFTLHNIAHKMIEQGHDLHLKSTDGLSSVPNDLKKYLVPGYHNHPSKGPAEFLKENGDLIIVDAKNGGIIPEIQDRNIPYDLEFAYTVPLQFPRRFDYRSRCRAAIWNYESSIIPSGWFKYCDAIDYLLPSSKYAYDIFVKNNFPKEKMIIIPHGVDTNLFNKNIIPYKLKTNKKIKFLHVAIPHARKFHEKVITGFCESFTANDDVCLVLKTKFKEPDNDKPFEVNVEKILNNVLSKYKNPPEIEVVNNIFFENIAELYNACDVIVSMSSSECFDLPLLEALACEKLVIAPRHGGQLEFLNDNNSLLVNTDEMFAPFTHQYWHYAEKSIVGNPDVKHFSELLLKAYKNFEQEKERVKINSEETVNKFNWNTVAEQICSLPIPKISKRISYKIKTLYIIPYNIIGGGEIWVKDIINKLDKNIYEPTVALLNSTQELKDLFKDTGAKIEDLTNYGKLESLKCLIESSNYNIINFYNSLGIYNLLKSIFDTGYRFKIVEIVHSDLVWADSMSKVSKRNDFVSLIITVSDLMNKKLVKYGNKNVLTFPHPINYDRFNIKKDKSILKSLGIPDNFIIGFVGRVSPEKNIPLILNIAKNIKEASFVIVGDGPQLEILKNIAPNNVYFIGRKNNVEDFYASFDMLLITSTTEGLPLVILEAMACGIPTISSDVGAINEIIINNFNGNLIKCNNINEYITKIKNLISDKSFLNKLSINCKNFISELKNKKLDINNIYKELI